MNNDISLNCSAKVITTLLHALIEISTTAKAAHECVSRDEECAGSVVPHSLAAVQQLADHTVSTAIAMLEADIKNIQGAHHDA